MIIVAINDKATIEHYGNLLAERTKFNEMCNQWKEFAELVTAEKDPMVAATFQRDTDTMIMRTINNGEQATIVITLVNDLTSIAKNWQFQDHMVDNRQGGQTHIYGWQLI